MSEEYDQRVPIIQQKIKNNWPSSNKDDLYIPVFNTIKTDTVDTSYDCIYLESFVASNARKLPFKIRYAKLFNQCGIVVVGKKQTVTIEYK